MIFAIKKSKKCYFYQKGPFSFKIFSENHFVIKIEKMSVSQNSFHKNGYLRETMVTSSRAD